MQKDYNKHETNWSEDDWKKATVVTWKTPAKNFPTADDLKQYLNYYLERMHQINENDVICANYRDVWQKDNEHYVVVSWNVGRQMSDVARMIEHTFKELEKESFYAEVLKMGYGKNYTEEAVCFQNCVRVLETVDGNLVAVNQVRRALGIIQANNGYALKDDIDDDDIDDDNDDDDVPEAAE